MPLTRSSDGPSPLPEWLLSAGILLAAICVCLPALASMAGIWSRTQYLAHGYAIPAVSALLAFRNRAALGQALTPPTAPALGPLAVIGAAGFEALAIIGDVGFLAGLGIPLLLAAVAYAVGGTALLRPMALPLGFLLLMVPPPRSLTYDALFRLKLAVTQLSVRTLQLAGETVASDGNQILLPGNTLFVADACSGLNSIVSLLPLACIVAYFLSHGVWRRAVVIASVLPLAIGANLLRVIVTVMLVDTRGAAYAQGLLHEAFGLTTFVLGTLVLLGLARVLR
jgi:exosortase